MDPQKLNELDLSEAGNWPRPAKAVAIVLVCAAVAAAGYWFDLRHQIDTLNQARTQEASLKQQFTIKQAKAANLKVYKRQMAQIEETFEVMLHQLPGRTEVADLLVDITQTGLSAGLTFELFKPQQEAPKTFYAELPIQIRVRGHYHEFGKFISGIAALPRIVTVDDIRITPVENDSEGTLVMELTAYTYRYLEPGERPQEERS